MKDIDQIRRENMVILQNEVGGPTAAAARLGWDQSQWSNLKNGAADSKTGKPRGMHKTTARKIEAAFGRDEFWLDTNHNAKGAEPAGSPANELTPREQALFGLFKGLTDSQKDALIRELQEKKQQNDELLTELLKRKAT